MCYNCGCGMPDEDHGDPKNITNKTLEELAQTNNQTIEEVKGNIANTIDTSMDEDSENEDIAPTDIDEEE